eukprot:4664866-Pyramimonas_sp.AAC.1
MEIRYQKHMGEQNTPQDRRRCDRTAMMNAITHGVGKSGFLADIAEELAARGDQFRQLLEEGAPDNYFELLESTLTNVGYRHLSITGERRDRQEGARER